MVLVQKVRFRTSISVEMRVCGSYKWMFRSSGVSVLETGMSALNSL